jgi:hypothetical protein
MLMNDDLLLLSRPGTMCLHWIRNIKRTLAILMLLAATPASATDAMTFCRQELTADVAKYNDDEFKSTLCTASKMYVQAAKAGDNEASSACMKAMKMMKPEFARRFPGRKPHEVVGRCE